MSISNIEATRTILNSPNTAEVLMSQNLGGLGLSVHFGVFTQASCSEMNREYSLSTALFPPNYTQLYTYTYIL